MKDGKTAIITTIYNNASTYGVTGAEIFVSPTISSDLSTFTGDLYFRTDMRYSKTITAGAYSQMSNTGYKDMIKVTISSGAVTNVANITTMGYNLGTIYELHGATETYAWSTTTQYGVVHKKYVDDTIATSISNKIWIGTQTEYDNLSSYSDSTLYFIKEDSNVSA